MTPTAMSLVSTTFAEGPERNKALAIWGMNGAFGATAGYLIAGPLVDGPGWEWIFFINLPVGLLALVLSPVLLPESRAATATRSYDPAGALTITAALVALVYALVEAPDAGWDSPQTILLLAGAAAFLALFALIESRHRAPLVPLRVLRSRTLAGANAVMLLFATVAAGMPFILTLYAQQVLGYSALEFGVAFVVVPVAAAAGMMVSQSAVLRFGFRPVAATGMALLAAGSLALTQMSVGGSYAGDLLLGLLLFGAGIGPAFVTASIAALQGVGERDAGLASGLSNTAFQLGWRARRRDPHDGRRHALRGTPDGGCRSGSARRPHRGLPVRAAGLCRPGRGRDGARARAPRPPRKAGRERLEPLAATGGVGE